MTRVLHFFLVALLGLIAAAPAARAHDPGLSTVEATWTPEGLVLTAGFSPADAAALVPDATGGGKVTAERFAAQRTAFDALAAFS